jgi:hypothetical protein
MNGLHLEERRGALRRGHVGKNRGRLAAAPAYEQ